MIARRCLAVAIVALSAGTAGSRAAADCPAWLRQAAATPLDPSQAAEPAVVLLDDLAATVDDHGKLTTRRTYAARVQTQEGRRAAALREWYLTDTGKVREMRGWIIRPSGDVQELDKERVLDLALAPNDVYNEARMRVIDAGAVEPGTIFGAEVVSEDRSVFAQAEWPLQDRWAVRSVTRRLTLPRGWHASAVTFNHAVIQPSVVGTTYTWSAGDVPAIDDEPSSLPKASLVARLAVSYAPPEPSSDIATFTDWSGVARWLSAISDTQVGADAALIAKARELTADLSSDADRIRAIAAYVQHTQYISIQIGLGRGGGYRPRPAAVVFARNQGDCKDKANLMRAMLAAVGIRAYLVSAFAGDRTYVREGWPSPQQFNHCIVAIVVDAATTLSGPIIDMPTLGRLLIFDPTAEHTPVGALPDSEQGSLALIVSPDHGALVRLPDAVAGANGYDRLVEGAVTATGQVDATVRFRARGDAAATERSIAAGLATGNYQALFERRVSADIPGARVGRLTTKADAEGFEVSTRVEAARYAQVMQSSLLVFKPPFRSTEEIPVLKGSVRKGPIVIKGIEVGDTLSLEVPAGFAVDEVPQASSLTTPFGTYTLKARQEGQRVIVERHCLLIRAVVPAAEYGALRAFFDKARAADSSPIVLQRR